jgi:polyisoprenoid-binding protein YceI
MTTTKPLVLAATAAALAAAAGAAQAQGASYSIDPTHTFVTFEVGHFGTSFNRGRWDKKEGSVQFDRAGKTGRVEITIEMESVNTGVPPFDRHLKSKDFFDVAQFPQARFVGERFVFAGDKVSEVQGQLTLMGKTVPVTLAARLFNCYQNPIFKREVCGGDFEATLKRSAFGIGYGLPAIAPDEVKLLIQVEAIRQ